MSSTMLATAARILHRLLQRNDLNADALYIECGLDPLKLNDPKARYQVDRIRKLASLADARIDNPCWGMAAGDLWKPTDFHALGYTFIASRTLESALHRLERYQRIVIQDLAFRSITEGDNVSIQFVPSSADADIPAFHDARVSMVMRMCREAYGEDLPVHEVTLTHPWQPCSYEEYFGCPVRYDAQYSSFSLPLDVMRQPLPAVNRDLARANERILTDSSVITSLPDRRTKPPVADL